MEDLNSCLEPCFFLKLLMINSDCKFLATLKAFEIFVVISMQKGFQLLIYTVNGECIIILL